MDPAGFVITTRTLTGDGLTAALADLARLRIAVFRDWPYLYDGDEAYEREYLRAYAAPGDEYSSLLCGKVTIQFLCLPPGPRVDGAQILPFPDAV